MYLMVLFLNYILFCLGKNCRVLLKEIINNRIKGVFNKVVDSGKQSEAARCRLGFLGLK